MTKPSLLNVGLALAVSAVALQAPAAFAQTMQGAPSSGSSTTTTTTTAPSTAGGTILSRADQQILKDLAMEHMNEIDMAKTALSKSQNPDVKNFAQHMIDDHTRSLQDVQQLAQAKAVTLPSELDSRHKAGQNRLSSLSGDELDRRYLDQAGVAEHREDHRMLQQAQARATDAEIKSLAAKNLAVEDQHLAMAQRSQAALGGRSSMGTSGSTGTGESGATTMPNSPNVRPNPANQPNPPKY
jgi:putative membrane protein